MARPLGSGPVHCWIGFGLPNAAMITGQGYSYPPWITGTSGAAQARYFGTTRSGPDIDPDIGYYPIMNDITGPKHSMDEGFAGEEHTISLSMTSRDMFSENILNQYMRIGPSASPIVVPPIGNAILLPGKGTIATSDLGSMMLSEGKTIQLWLMKAAALKAVNVGAGMPIGRYYMTCILMGVKPVEGNKENVTIFTFKAKENIYGLNSALIPGGVLPLYNEAASNFAALPPAFFG